MTKKEYHDWMKGESWTVDKYTHDGRRFVFGDDGCTNIASVFGSTLSEDDQHPINKRRDANANLIAAAPDLLEVAKKLSDWEMDPDRYAGTLADLAHEARIAIIKAKGGDK